MLAAGITSNSGQLNRGLGAIICIGVATARGRVCWTYSSFRWEHKPPIRKIGWQAEAPKTNGWVTNRFRNCEKHGSVSIRNHGGSPEVQRKRLNTLDATPLFFRDFGAGKIVIQPAYSFLQRCGMVRDKRYWNRMKAPGNTKNCISCYSMHPPNPAILLQ